jgi:amidase
MSSQILKIALLSLLIAAGACSNQESSQNQTSVITGIQVEELTIDQLRQAYAGGAVTIPQVVRIYLDRIEAIDRGGPELNSVIAINPDAMEIARQQQQELEAGRSLGPLHGIPVLVKDNIDTRDGMPNTAGSRALAGSFPERDAHIVAQLRQAGAIILGKTNLSEWANFRAMLSSSGWSGHGGQTRNPYDPDRNPCGSSSGSGVAVAANLCMLAIGTETNGSIVCPSNNNGIVGIKPTVGLLSRSGIIPISFTQDTPGPMARTVTDAVIGLGAMTGTDTSDRMTMSAQNHASTDYTPYLKADGLSGKRIGLIRPSMGFHPKVDALVAETVEILKSRGAEVVEVDFSLTSGTEDASFQVLLYEFKDGLNRYLSSLGESAPVKDLAAIIEFNKRDSLEMKYFDQSILEMAQEKGDLTSPEYLEALSAMQKASREEGIDRVMDQYRLDALMAPTGSPAWMTDRVNGDHYMGGSSSFAAIAGYPNLSVPMGFIDGLPVGISFFGKAWSEPVLIEIAFGYEQAHTARRPPQFAIPPSSGL